MGHVAAAGGAQLDGVLLSVKRGTPDPLDGGRVSGLEHGSQKVIPSPAAPLVMRYGTVVSAHPFEDRMRLFLKGRLRGERDVAIGGDVVQAVEEPLDLPGCLGRAALVAESLRGRQVSG